MDLGIVRGVIAVITLFTFLGICWWAYRPGNRSRFEEDALLAFDPDEMDQISSVTQSAKKKNSARPGDAK